MFNHHNCNQHLDDFGDWFPYLCMVKHNSPYLGLHYINSPSIIRQQKGLKATLDELFRTWNLWEDVSTEKKKFDSSVYHYGSPLFTLNSDTDSLGILSLPARTLTGQCIEAAPLQFLIAQEALCNIVVTPNSCSDHTVLSSTFYLSENSSDEQVLSRADTLEMANLSVNYVCSAPDIDWTEWSSQRIPLCNSSNLKPVYDADLMICENAVQRVEYRFWWNGPQIVKVNVSIFLGNVSLAAVGNSGPMSTITQSFQTLYFHSREKNDSDVSNETSSALDYDESYRPYVRSGNPGYDVGRLLITGIPKNEDGNSIFNDSDFSFVDISHNSSIRLIRSGKSRISHFSN